MPVTSRTAGLLLVALAACQPGEAPHPSSPALGLTISGSVSGAGGTVTVRASGPVSASAQTDLAGQYQLIDLPRGVYTLTVLAPRTLAFAPGSRQVTLLDRGVAGQDFAGSTVALLEGTVSGAGAAGATVTLRGPVSRTVASTAAGYYRFDDLPGGTYSVAAASAGFGYTPVSALVTVVAGLVTTRDFTSAAQAGNHTIAGSVVGGAPAGVLLTLSGDASGQTLSDGDGHYRFDGLADGDYQVAVDPVAGYLWQARSRPATLAGADVTGLDFTEVAPKVARFAYVLAQPGQSVSWVIHQYAVGVDGALTPLTPATVDAGGAGPTVADPSGRWFYALSMATSGAISQWVIGADGALTPLATPTVTGLSSPRLLAMDPKGRWLWVHEQAGTLWRYTIGADGALTSPTSTVVGGAVELVAHPSGDHLYVVSSGAVNHYLVAASGALTLASPAGVGVPASLTPVPRISRMTLDPTGKYAYLSAFDTFNPPAPSDPHYLGWLLPYAVDAAGTMSSVGSPVSAQGYSQINFGPQQVAVDASGRFAWVAPDGSAYYAASGVARYALGTDGLPTLLGVYDPLPLFNGQGLICPARLAPDPGGTRLYAASSVVNGAYEASARVAWFDIRADGGVSYGGDLPIGLMAQSLTLVSY